MGLFFSTGIHPLMPLQGGAQKMLNQALMARRAKRARRAFSLVEILIVILIMAVLLAVALPQLLGSRDSGLDSAAKQQLSNAMSEISSYTLRTETAPTYAQVTALSKNLSFLDDGESGIIAGTNARSISYAKSATAGELFRIAVKGAKGNCWGILLKSDETLYYGKADDNAAASCKASTLGTPPGAPFPATSPWKQYAFPSDAVK
jgi:prepilin-type N-terminal cleavage/methylation domain-containing protein